MKLLTVSFTLLLSLSALAQSNFEKTISGQMQEFKQIRIENDIALSQGALTLQQHNRKNKDIRKKMLEVGGNITIKDLKDLSAQDIDRVEQEIIILFESQQITQETMLELTDELSVLRTNL